MGARARAPSPRPLAQAAQRQRLEAAEAHAFDYRLPNEVKRQREHERRSRARLRSHDVIENRIQEAMASGAFDDLPGAGKPLQREENVFEAMSGDALAHRVLKNAGIAPGSANPHPHPHPQDCWHRSWVS